MSKMLDLSCLSGTLAEAKAWARETLPLSQRCLHAAIQAIDAGQVQRLTTRYALVSSAKDRQEYMVVGTTCGCPGFRTAAHGWCRHRVAVAILRHAYALAAEHARVR